MKRIAVIVGIILIAGLLLSVVPAALATGDTGQVQPSLPLLDNDQAEGKARPWHLWGKVRVLKGTVEKVTAEDGQLSIELEEGQIIQVSEDAIKGPIKSRIFGGIEDPEELEGAVIVALVYEDGAIYTAKHIVVIPGTVASVLAARWKRSVSPTTIQLEGTIDSISGDTIVVDTGSELEAVTYDEATVVVIKGATGLETGDEITVVALKTDDELLAKSILAGLQPGEVTQWLERHRIHGADRD
jgi:hypothetical protein